MDLPEPLSPIIPKISPELASKFKLFKITLLLIFKLRFFSLISDIYFNPINFGSK